MVKEIKKNWINKFQEIPDWEGFPEEPLAQMMFLFEGKLPKFNGTLPIAV